MNKELLNLADTIIEKAVKAGAQTAEILIAQNASISATSRLNQVENVERSESIGLGLRIIIDQKQSIVSTTSFADDNISQLVSRAIDMANAAIPDPFISATPKELLADQVISLELYEDNEPKPDVLVELAKNTENAALSVSGVTNSQGATASHSNSFIIYANNNGFNRSYKTTKNYIGVSVIAGSDADMQTDSYSSQTRIASDLKSPEFIGTRAGELAVQKLYPRKINTTKLPVVFDARIAETLLFDLITAINGVSIARGSSFLKNKIGSQIFPKAINIIDDPLVKRGLRSYPFDGEGIIGRKLAIVENGILTDYLLDLRSARQLGKSTNGRAARGLSSPPSPTASNFYLAPGTISQKELLGNIKQGLFVTSLFSTGTNIITGDYSRGASGFMIENGVITYPVNEITIASNLSEMFKNILAANDLEFLYGIDSPTIAIEAMTIAGV